MAFEEDLECFFIASVCEPIEQAKIILAALRREGAQQLPH
jgi:hypothetical protein